MNGAENWCTGRFLLFTFALASLFLGGLVLLYHPDLLEYFLPHFPHWCRSCFSHWYVVFCRALCVCSAFKSAALPRFGSVLCAYPRLAHCVLLLALRQAPPGILPARRQQPRLCHCIGIFLSFTAALLSHAPGGIGVVEALFFIALPEIKSPICSQPADFPLVLFLFCPFAISIVLVALFERKRLMEYLRQRTRKNSASPKPRGL